MARNKSQAKAIAAFVKSLLVADIDWKDNKPLEKDYYDEAMAFVDSIETKLQDGI